MVCERLWQVINEKLEFLVLHHLLAGPFHVLPVAFEEDEVEGVGSKRPGIICVFRIPVGGSSGLTHFSKAISIFESCRGDLLIRLGGAVVIEVPTKDCQVSSSRRVLNVSQQLLNLVLSQLLVDILTLSISVVPNHMSDYRINGETPQQDTHHFH